MNFALVDTTVLYAAGNRDAQRHERALPILRAVDRGGLPSLVVPDPVAMETMNGLSRDVDHPTAVDFLERLEAGRNFDVTREPLAVWQRGLGIFRSIERLSLADGLIVASLRHHDIEYLYAFDDDFDGVEGVARLETADDPYDT